MNLLEKWVESLDYEYEILDTCTRFRSPLSTCEKCIESCDYDAISIVNKKPVLDVEKCVECGNCIAACPEQAVAGIFPKRTLLQNELVITRDHIPTVKELLVFYKKGIRSIRTDDPSLTERWQTPVDETNRMLVQLGEEPISIAIKRAEEVEEEKFSRRDLFSLWKKESKSIITQIAPAKWRFNHTDLNLAKYYADFQFTNIHVDIETCTLCTACEKLCYKDCFKIADDGFYVMAGNCSSCQLCVDICPEKAIKVQDEISTIHDITYPVYTKHCDKCKRDFTTLRESDEICVICTKRAGFL